MPKIINPALIGNWENWLRILLMVAIGAAAFHFASQYLNRKKGS